MYERLSSGWHNRLSGQKMKELQELEAYRKADGIAAMTSRSRGERLVYFLNRQKNSVFL